MRDNYVGTAFAAEFATRNDAVRTAGSSAFLRDLRNYLLHYGVLAFVHQVSFPSETSPFVSEVRLNCTELQVWDRWSAAAKSYTAHCGESIHLSATAQEYISNMEALYQWVFEQFESLHGDDTDAANRLVAEVNLTMSGGVTDGRDWHAFMAHVQENLRARREGREQTSYVRPEASAPPSQPEEYT